MNFSEELKWRGTIKQCTNENVLQLIDSEKLVFYIGYDPTGDSLHVGSLLQIVNSVRMQNNGHTPIVLTGGFTGLIGDPSGKNAERTLLTIEQVRHNEKMLKEQLSKYFDNENTIYESNYNWFGEMSLLDFLRFTGKRFNISEMIKKDIVASRLETGISFTEFSYQTLQAHDWLELYKRHNCVVQFGGSDQWGNLTAGTELIRKTLGKEIDVYGITTPLVTKADGTKFGKSESGTIWLDKDKTTEYELYQFFINSLDEDVIKYLKYFTFLNKEEIDNLEKCVQEEPYKRQAQKVLAKEVVEFVHGKAGLKIAIDASEALFSNNVKSLDQDTFKSLIPLLKNKYANIENSTTLIDALVSSKLASSKREAREFLKNNAIRINDEIINDENYILNEKNALFNKYFICKRGKKQQGLFEIK